MATHLSKLRQLGRQADKTVFACSSELSLASDGHIQIFYKDGSDSHVSLSLPAASGDSAIDQLVNACTPATFGKGTTEVLDKSYRDAVAMDTSKFATSFQLSEYPQVLSEIHSILVSDQKQDALVLARMYKLNVYGKDGFFKAHRDTPRGDAQMFGTLVVCLPSTFEGGDFVVRSDNGFEQRCVWGGHSSSSIQWCAFYSDCEHEVLPVTSGHRVTLTYLLERVPIPSPVDPGRAIAVSKMEKTLRDALADPTFARFGAKLGFGLNHGYVVGENIEEPMLKGADRALKATLDRLGLHYVFLPVYGADNYDPDRFKQAQDAQQQGGDGRLDEDFGEYGRGRLDVTEFEMPGVEEPPPLDQDDPFYAGDGANHLLVGSWDGFTQVIDVAPDEEYCCDGLDFENLDLHTTREVLWIAPPVNFPLEKCGATYGNEPTMSSYYAAASIIAWVPSVAKRSQVTGEPKSKKTKRDEELEP